MKNIFMILNILFFLLITIFPISSHSVPHETLLFSSSMLTRHTLTSNMISFVLKTLISKNGEFNSILDDKQISECKMRLSDLETRKVFRNIRHVNSSSDDDDKRRASDFNKRAAPIKLHCNEYDKVIINGKSLYDHSVNLCDLLVSLKEDLTLSNNIEGYDSDLLEGYDSDLDNVKSAETNKNYLTFLKFMTREKPLDSCFILDDLNKHTEIKLLEYPENYASENGFNYQQFLSSLPGYEYKVEYKVEDTNDAASQIISE